MKNQLLPSLIFLILISYSCKQTTVGEMKFPEGKVQHVVRASEINWQPCPPNLPDGCEIAVLEGSPKNADLFTVRFRITKDFYMPPHTHPKDERATIIEGKAFVAFGEDAAREDAKEFGPGDYYVNARGAVHTVWIDAGSILQLTGVGPWEVHFIEK